MFFLVDCGHLGYGATFCSIGESAASVYKNRNARDIKMSSSADDGSAKDQHPKRVEGRFQAGSSGNPNGRPKGSRNRSTSQVEELLDNNEAAIITKILEKAREGDHQSAQLCVRSLYPRRRARPVLFDLPSIETLGDAKRASAAVCEAAGTGELTLDQADAYMSLIERHARVIEHAELAARVEMLEKKLEKVPK
jgi:uncharacterized protein DUF5681